VSPVRVVLALAALLAAGIVPPRAAAQPVPGLEAAFVVRDAATGGPVQARIVLRGPVEVGAVCDVDGAATIGELPEGRYELTVERAGYTVVRRPLDLERGGSVSVEVRLSKRGALRQIGSVAVRVRNVEGRYAQPETSALRELSSSTAEALAASPGVALAGGDAPGRALTVSLEGHDPTATALALDGVPLNVPGVAANLAGLDLDLVDRFSVAYGPAGAASGGSLAIQTLAPTASWQSQLATAYGSFDRSYAAFSEQGTIGRVGVAYKHAFRAQTSPLDGADFADASGLDYVHRGGATSRGDVLKLQVRGRSNDVSVTALRSSEQADALCPIAGNAVPCGYGPGNGERAAFSLFSVADAFAVGSTAWTLTHYDSSERLDADLSHELFDGVPAPFTGSSSVRLQGFSAGGEASPGRHALNLRASVSALRLGASDSAGLFAQSDERRLRYATLALGDRYRAGSRLALEAGADAASLTATPGSVTAHGGLTLTAPRDTVSLVATAGRGFTADSSVDELSGPGQLLVDCGAGTASGAGPGAPSRGTSFGSLRLTWSRLLARGSVTAQVYAQKERDTALSALVPATAFPAAGFPAGYFDVVNELYRLPTNCGGAASIGPSSVYLRTAVPGVDIAYEGARVQAALPLGRALVFEGWAQLSRAAAWSANPLLTDPRSVFRPGAQLPGVPLASAFASVAYRPASPNRLEAVAGIRYAGYGNAASLPPHVVVDAAVGKTLRNGRLSLVANNLFDAYAGTFVSPRYAVPLITYGGTAIPGLAAPNPPRRVELRYAVALGPGARPQDDLAKAVGAGSAESDTLAPGYLLSRWPLTQPREPFRRNPGTVCSPARAALAETVVKALRDAAAAVEAAKAEGRYPAAFPGTPPVFAGGTVAYARTARSYVLTITFTQIGVSQAVFDCQDIHLGSPENLADAGLPPPPAPSLTTVTLAYAPEEGIYFVQVPRPKEQRPAAFRAYALPAQPPARPFEAAGSAACDAGLRPIAERLLAELAAYFAPGLPPSGSSGAWTIVRHDAPGGAWYELRSDEIGAVTSVGNCAHVSAATRSEIAARRLDGAPPPAFNYAPQLGIYMIDGR
jgi:Carboxypeptidase regulatory-like domain/TonB-dependent Receptor Plug Domain